MKFTTQVYRSKFRNGVHLYAEDYAGIIGRAVSMPTQRAKPPLGNGAGNGAGACCGCAAERTGGAVWTSAWSGAGAVVRLRTIFLGLGAGGAAAAAPSSSGTTSGSGATAGSELVVAACLPLPFDFEACFGFASSGAAAAAAAAVLAFCSCCCCALPLYKSFGTPCSSPGTPSGKTGLRSPGSFFLVSRESSKSVGSQFDRPLEQPASALDSATRTVAAIRRCERRMFYVSLGSFRRQLFATGGSNACRASARERRPGGVSPSLAIMSSHFRAATASPARQADNASISRAVWRNVAPGAAEDSSRADMSG